MTNAFIFDLDGVLIDSKEIHFEALNLALSEIDKKYVISQKEQFTTYEGLSTKAKLNLLTYHKGLPVALHESIWKKKQLHSTRMFEVFEKDTELIELFKMIKKFGIKIGVASNAISETVESSLKSLGVYPFVDRFLSNEHVENPKPNPEIYLLMMSLLGSTPGKTVIFEDSDIGRLSARESGGILVPINKRKDIDFHSIIKAMSLLKPEKQLNVVIPMAGSGSRFADAGYADPKPLIDVNGRPMIARVIESLGILATYTFIVQEAHYKKYNLQKTLSLAVPNCNIVRTDELTDGAARTVLLAKALINNSSPLIIANSDQLVTWNSEEFLKQLLSDGVDGNIALFNSQDKKWSYAEIKDDRISMVAEKQVISHNASVGIYGWRHGADYVRYAQSMIDKKIKTNGEFYICPVYNRL